MSMAIDAPKTRDNGWKELGHFDGRERGALCLVAPCHDGLLRGENVFGANTAGFWHCRAKGEKQHFPDRHKTTVVMTSVATFHRTREELEEALHPVTTDAEVSALLVSLRRVRGPYSREWEDDIFANSFRVARLAVGLSDYHELFQALRRWALEAYADPALESVLVYDMGSGPVKISYTAAQCRYAKRPLSPDARVIAVCRGNHLVSACASPGPHHRRATFAGKFWQILYCKTSKMSRRISGETEIRVGLTSPVEE